VRGPATQDHYLLLTKIYDLPKPIYDLIMTKNTIQLSIP